jgi:putative transcriptional regulator
MAKITNRIRRLRFDNGEMTQEELARRAGCTRQTIIALEQGKYVPSVELAFRIARSLNTTIEDIFQYE